MEGDWWSAPWIFRHPDALWAVAVRDEAEAGRAWTAQGGLAGANAGASTQWVSSRMALEALEEGLAVQLAKDGDGRPVLPQQEICVSLSHTGGLGAAALSRHPAVVGLGVDLEWLHPRMSRVLPRIATEEEQALLHAVLGGRATDGDEAWLVAGLLWVVKEAAFKAARDPGLLFGKEGQRVVAVAPLQPETPAVAKGGGGSTRWQGTVNQGAAVDFYAGLGTSRLAEDPHGEPKHWVWAVAWSLLP